jgi:hypothetical protein
MADSQRVEDLRRLADRLERQAASSPAPKPGTDPRWDRIVKVPQVDRTKAR